MQRGNVLSAIAIPGTGVPPGTPASGARAPASGARAPASGARAPASGARAPAARGTPAARLTPAARSTPAARGAPGAGRVVTVVVTLRKRGVTELTCADCSNTNGCNKQKSDYYCQSHLRVVLDYYSVVE